MPSSAVLGRAAPRGCPRRAARSSSAATASFSGTSVSSRSSGTRPTSTRQIWKTIVRAADLAPSSSSGVPSGAVTRAIGRLLRVDRQPVLLLAAGEVEPLPEVAAAVEQADADHRQRLVARLLEDVAGEHAEAARVDRHRDVERRTRRRRTRPGRRRPGRGRAGRARSCGDLATSASIRARSSGFRSTRLLRRGPEIGQEAHRIPAGQHPAGAG